MEIDIILISATVLSVAFVAWSRRRDRAQEEGEPVKPAEPVEAKSDEAIQQIDAWIDRDPKRVLDELFAGGL